MSPAWSAVVEAQSAAWRERLLQLGFSDDGVRLHGPVAWRHPDAGMVRAQVEVEPDEVFPFAPPPVRVLEPGAEVEFTFHLDRPRQGRALGNLCLWDTDWAVDQAPWNDPVRLLARISGWLEKTAAGWPDDDVCDLERYLPLDERLVVYDNDALAGVVRGLVRTRAGAGNKLVTVTSETRATPQPGGRRRRGRKNARLAWVGDLGEVTRPVRGWSDLAAALGRDAGQVQRLVALGAVEFLLLRYSRGGRPSTLALSVRVPDAGAVPEVRACESADVSVRARTLRAGAAARELVECKVAVVGLGAVGSFLADALFRSGLRHLTLMDAEILRPGNLVRHLAGNAYLGVLKVHAVRACLATRGLDVEHVEARPQQLCTLAEAVHLVQTPHVVVDATAEGRASSLLATAAQITGRTVVSVCVQRNGDVLRVDRFPLRGVEKHLPALAPLSPANEEDLAYERGCGSPVSLTPPGAVMAAAEWGSQVAIDEATLECSLPASIVEVRRPQLDPPYDELGTHTSGPARR